MAKQLFDVRDPAPFRERDLDDELVEYLVSSAEEFSLRVPLSISIRILEHPDPGLDADAIVQAIVAHFTYEADLKRKRLTRVLKTGQAFLAVGLVSLFICLGLAELSQKIPYQKLRPILREGLLICGWVAMWRPIELVLYDWWPLLERIRLYRKLTTTPLRVVYESAPETARH
jgi:hypothetical protein